MHLSLGKKITGMVLAVFAAATVSALVAILSAAQIQRLLEQAITENVPSVRAADELEICLLEQRNFVMSYVVADSRADWLSQLREREPQFGVWYQRALDIAFTQREREILAELDVVYRKFSAQQNEAIRLADEGQPERAKQLLLADVPHTYQQAYRLCEELLEENERFVHETTDRTRKQVRRTLVFVASCVGLTFVLSTALLTQFYRGLLRPLRQMAEELRQLPVDGRLEDPLPQDEMRAVGAYLRRLMTDVAETRSTLAQSRDELVNAEQLASVGRLAASVAHEIRNPLTAMKMWLFSLRRGVAHQADALERVDLVSREITRLQDIVHHFLEFARPPELKLRPIAVADVVQGVLALFASQIEDERIRLRVDVPATLPQVNADADQLKQVLINLVKNAIEATGPGGQLQITAERAQQADAGQLRVEVRNSGDSLTPEVAARIFEPFFSTKAEGSGLGLCIAARIMVLHGGRIELAPPGDLGTAFVIWIPTLPGELRA